MANSKKVGSGKRFSSLVNKLENKGKSPEASKKIAASIGRKKYGGSAMEKKATAGRKRATNKAK